MTAMAVVNKLPGIVTFVSFPYIAAPSGLPALSRWKPRIKKGTSFMLIP